MPRLIWQDKRISGKRLAPAKPAPLPLRTLEIIDPNPFGRDDPLPLPGHADPDKGWRNQLLWGDNKYIMASLPPSLAGKIDLIYIDPPFATGGDFSISIPLQKGKRRAGESAIQKRAYRDRWEGGLDSYLLMMSERLSLMRDLLADDGSIYVHLDWHAGHYVKILMDEIFGRENFRNEIVWCYRTMQTSKRGWARKHDIILFYTKGENYTFNLKEVLEPYPPDYQRRFRYTDDRGRRFMIRGKGGPFGFGQGDIRIEEEEKYPQFTYRQYMQQGSIPKDWWEIEMLNSNSQERVGFETQKPEALLERIIKASSNPGDLVADFFCGSGTALVVAERLGRRWIGADLSGHALHTTRKRLLEIPHCRPFELLGPSDHRKRKLKEVNRLEVGHQWEGRTLNIFLKGLALCDRECLSEGLKAKMKHPLDYIDYWAVDFDCQGQTFHSQWQSFRTKKHPRLETRCSHRYEKEGSYCILVQVIDLFGNETRQLLELSTMRD